MGVKTFLWHKKQTNDQIKLAAKHIKPHFIACELLVLIVVTFGMVL